MDNKLKIREVCGDYALDIPFADGSVNPIHLKKNARKSICIISCTTRITATVNTQPLRGLEEFKEDKEND